MVLRKFLGIHIAEHTKRVKHMVSNLIMRETVSIPVFQMMKWKHPGNREGRYKRKTCREKTRHTCRQAACRVCVPSHRVWDVGDQWVSLGQGFPKKTVSVLSLLQDLPQPSHGPRSTLPS